MYIAYGACARAGKRTKRFLSPCRGVRATRRRANLFRRDAHEPKVKKRLSWAKNLQRCFFFSEICTEIGGPPCSWNFDGKDIRTLGRVLTSVLQGTTKRPAAWLIPTTFRATNMLSRLSRDFPSSTGTNSDLHSK